MTFIFARCGYYGLELCPGESVVAWETLLTKLAEPKPWARPAKADLGKWGANVRHFTPEHKAWVKRRGMWSSSKVDWRSLRRKRRAAQRRRR